MSEYRYFLLQKLLTVGVNILVLGSLFAAMYRASLYPQDFTITFFKTVFALLLPILVLGLLGKRVLNDSFSVSK